MSEGATFDGLAPGVEAPSRIHDERQRRDVALTSLIRLTILSETRYLRDALIEALARDDGFVVLGADRGEIAASIAASPPQVLLIDTSIADGPRIVHQLRLLAPQARFVALALVDDEPEVLRWAQAGICGYVHRDAALRDLGVHIQAILRGEQPCSRKVAAGLLRWIAAGSGVQLPDAQTKGTLTKREQEVADLLATGFSNKEISRRLCISIGTTKSHVHSVLCKLHLSHRSGVSRYI